MTQPEPITPSLRIQRQTPWQIQKSVVFSIFIRELRTRFGRFRLGYLWAVLEPISLIVILSSVRLVFGDNQIAGLPFPVFFASGITAYLLFNHITTSSLYAVESNEGLFNYQRVKPFDVFFARALLELLIAASTAVVILPTLYLLGYRFEYNDTLLLLATVACLFAFSFGVGLVVGIVGPLWRESQKIIPVLIRPFFFISGIFFAAGDVPPHLRDLAMVNPLLHATELLRNALFREYTSSEGSLFALFCWALASLFVGLLVYRIAGKSLITSGKIR